MGLFPPLYGPTPSPPRKRAGSQYLTAETGTLSPYDEWFREYASIPGWDWRLVAAQAFQDCRAAWR